MPGYLYQIIEGGKRARQQRDRKRVRETEHCWKRGIALAINLTIRENMWRKCVRLISEVIRYR
jgi:hypothetical protein